MVTRDTYRSLSWYQKIPFGSASEGQICGIECLLARIARHGARVIPPLARADSRSRPLRRLHMSKQRHMQMLHGSNAKPAIVQTQQFAKFNSWQR